MPSLVAPDPRVRESFVAAMAEFAAEGRGGPGERTVIGRYMRERADAWANDEGFAAFCAEISAQRLEETPRPTGFVPDTELWLVDREEWLGRIGIRHRLTPALLEQGGHIGYDVRPSARRRGHATAMLREALGVARGLGIESALLTCDVENVASRGVIERNGGVLEDERHGILRFWVPTPGRAGRHWRPSASSATLDGLTDSPRRAPMKVLVAYATRHGATRGIAERIGEVLQRHDVEVTVKPVEQAGSIDAYDAVVVGGAAYTFHWMKEASAFIRKHRAQLASRPVWVFTSGPTGSEPDEAKRAEALEKSIPKEFAEVAASIHPRGQQAFYGAYDPDAAPVGIAEGLFAKMTARWPSIREGVPAGDFRDWPAIEAWADEIARELVPVGA